MTTANTPRYWYEKALTGLLYIIPHHAISRLLFNLSRVENPQVSSRLIKFYTGLFSLNMKEAVVEDPLAYPSLNALFTRALKPEARPIADGQATLVSPADGVLSEFGDIENGQLIQAKGHHYSLDSLFAGETELAQRFTGGSFATVYLSPRDYHRVHMPLAGSLESMLYVPGRLFSVSLMTTRHIPNIFARNERVIAVFNTEFGLMAQVLVGAINVAAIETTWAGLVTPPQKKTHESTQYDNSLTFERGEEMGRFNMGSTVVLLTEKPLQVNSDIVTSGMNINLGEKIGVMQ